MLAHTSYRPEHILVFCETTIAACKVFISSNIAPKRRYDMCVRTFYTGSSGAVGQSQTDDFFDFDGMAIGENQPVEIGPFSSVKLEIVWKPTIPGKCDAHFIFTFQDPLSEEVSLYISAHCFSTGKDNSCVIYFTRFSVSGCSLMGAGRWTNVWFAVGNAAKS